MICIMSKWIHIFNDAPVRKIAKGAALFRQGDHVQSMYLVRSGKVALERPMESGISLTLHMATTDMALAEASLFATTYHCDAVAQQPSKVAVLSRIDFLKAIRKRPVASLSLIEAHAKEVQALRARIEILRLRRVTDRLDAWLLLYGMPPKGEWVRVANEIGVSQPALYRELAKRRFRSAIPTL